MSKPVLKLGSKGKAVKDLVKLLMKAMPDADLDPEFDEFDQSLYETVREWQKKAHLKLDGIIGKCGWNALQGTESFNYFTETPPFHDSSEMHCWKVATYHLLYGKGGPINPYFVTAGPAQTEYNLVGMGGIENSHENMALFAKHWHLTMLAEPTSTPGALAELIRNHGRVMLNVKKKDGNSHFICVCGIRGDGTVGGTTLSVLDPLYDPVLQPDFDSYAAWSYRFPQLFYQVFYR